MHTPLIRVISLTILFISGCQPAWNRVNQGQLKKDMRILLERYGCSGSFRSVAIIGTTRTGRIEIRITEEEIDKFIKGLNLQSLTNHDSFPITISKRIAELKESIVSDEPEDSDIRLFGVFGRDPSLRVSKYSSFEYLIMAYDNRKKLALIEVEYAYG